MMTLWEPLPVDSTTSAEREAFWKSACLATGPTDRDQAREAVCGFYQAVGLPTPRLAFVSSPLIMLFAGGFASGLRRLHATGATHFELGSSLPTVLAALNMAAGFVGKGIAKLALASGEGESIAEAILEATRAATADLTWPVPDWQAFQEVGQLCGQPLLDMADGLIADDVSATDLAETDIGVDRGIGRLAISRQRMAAICPVAAEGAGIVFFPSHGVIRDVWDATLSLATTTRLRSGAKLPLETRRSPVEQHVDYLLRCVRKCQDFISDDEVRGLSPAYEMACIMETVQERTGAKVNAQALHHYRTIALSAGPVFHADGFCIVSDRPAELHVRTEGRGQGPHNDHGPAIRWSDGIQRWSIDGIPLPFDAGEQIVLRPETQSVNEIDEEMNAEVRRIRIERFGWLRYLGECKPRIIDRRRNDVENTLELLCQTEGMRALVCHCPSTGRVYALPVPSEVRTCDAAQNWLWNRQKSRYGPARIIGRS